MVIGDDDDDLIIIIIMTVGDAEARWMMIVSPMITIIVHPLHHQ